MSSHAAGPAWQPWGEALFARAAQQQRLVVLHLGASWCHWCHVMERDTYGDERVQAALSEGFLASHVDHEQDPALATRYERYGWPATIILDAQGRELFKQAGYIRAEVFLQVLARLRANPEPLAQQAPQAAAQEGWAQQAWEELVEGYDPEGADWSVRTRALRWECAEALLRGDEQQQANARQHLGASLALLDPAWGGIYQYSTQASWEHPHYEKLMVFQAQGLRSHALAWLKWGQARHHDAARLQVRYLLELLRSPEGAFYASQDADLIPGRKASDYFRLGDAARRAQGIPAINKNLYARENGQAIRALATWFGASGDEQALQAAVQAVDWVMAHRALPGGGFKHGEGDARPFLGDSLAMGEAFWQLYEVTGDTIWLTRAEETARFVLRTFQAQDAPGLLTAQPGHGAVLAPLPQLEENVSAARWLNLLWRATGEQAFAQGARSALAHVASARLQESRHCFGGPLLAEQELRVEPVHVTVVGPRGSAQAQALFSQALKYPLWYRHIQWWDPAQGPLPYASTQYPVLERPAAFLCAHGVCSAPVFAPEALHEKMSLFAEALRR